jgi:hypothetical protein
MEPKSEGLHSDLLIGTLSASPSESDHDGKG